MANAFDFAPSDEAAAPASARTNAAEFTVAELSRAVKRTVEDGFGRVRVRGEISGFRGRHGSGHAYFSLKDADAAIDAVVWRGAYAGLGTPPEEGLEVIATGRLTTYARSSKYQIVIEQLEPAGLGALMKLLEARRKALAAEGLFDAARKRPLPAFPAVVGVVTSPTGAVIRDILHRVAERWPAHVVVWPVRVQGETSGAEVAAAVAGFAGDYGGPQPDVIIVARGGGSVEDLWGYNDEAVVRAVAASPIPVVSAVGHETDWTLVDHVADVRAPTPTGAAEMVMPVRADCLAAVADRARRLDVAVAQSLRQRRDRSRLLARTLPSGANTLSQARQRLDIAGDRLIGALVMAAAKARGRLGAAAGRLSPASAQRPLMRAADRLAVNRRQLDRAAAETLRRARERHGRAGTQPLSRAVGRTLADARTALDRLTARRERATTQRLEGAATRLAGAGKLLHAMSYQGVLARGFALVRRGDKPVRRKGEVPPGAALSLEFADGRVDVVEASGRPARARAKAVKRTSEDSAQGVLL